MSLLRYALDGNFKRFLNNIKNVAEEEKKSSFSIFCNFLSCFAKTGCGYTDYLNYRFYKLTPAELDEYVTIKHEDKFYETVSPSEFKKFFTIKPDFLKNFAKYIYRDFFVDGSVDDLRKFLDNNPEFMLKPYDGLGGHGVEKMKSVDVSDVEEFCRKLKEERLFVEGYVCQHAEMNRLCPASVNTIRVISFAVNGKSRIVFAALRVGNGSAAVDNFHAGGMACLVDLETGRLCGNAIDKELNVFEDHPLTGVHFDGFQIPNWDFVKQMVLEAALVNQNIHAVGWDVAVTQEGATFIEGNRRPGFDLVQVPSGRGRKDIMRDCLAELNAAQGTNYTI